MRRKLIIAGLTVLGCLAFVFGVLVGQKFHRDLTEEFDPREVREMSDGTPVTMDADCRLVDVRTGRRLDPKQGFTSYDQTRWEALCKTYQHERPTRPRLLPRGAP